MHSLWTKTIRAAVLISTAGFLLSCGPAGEDDELLGSSLQPLTAGNNAQFISSTVPLAMFPGERLDVQVVMRNTGTADPANTWGLGAYSLYRTSSIWSWVSTPLPATTNVSTNATFNLVITAPSLPGTYAFGARMRQDVLFGQTASVPNIVVSNATTPRWSCTYLPGSSNVPVTLAPSENRAVSIVVQNSGTATWQTANTYLKSQDIPASFWGNTVTPLGGSVAPGANATFNFTIRAPAAPGNYTLKRQIQNPEVGVFAGTCLNVPITVGGASPLNATLVSEDFPLVMAPSEVRIVNVVLNNSGSQTWTADANFRLGSKNSPSSLWGTTFSNVNAVTTAGNNHAFAFAITSPAAAGSYNHRWQMRKLAGADAGDFGVLIDVPMTVDNMAQPQYGATVVSQSIPPRMTVGSSGTFTIRMRNSGSASWVGSDFTLFSTNSPLGLWGPTNVALGAAETVLAAGERDFTLNVTAPATAGAYDSRWRLRQLSGIGFFGDEAITVGIDVTLCGNGAVDGGEQCDDGNLANGDGCSDTCQTENPVVVDLATDAADRTIIGLQTNKALANVAIGDFTGDGTRDVVVGQNINVSPPMESFRNQAGQLLGYTGTTFFGAGAAMLTVYGAEANDSLGAHGGAGLLVSDVTGDGIADIVVSAAGADGPLNARSGCGEVYVLAGGGALTGTVDLAASPAHAALRATVLGAATGNALKLLALGDLTNDGVNDLVLGGGGTIYVVPGGASLTGQLDLLAPPAGVQLVTGTGLGGAAAVGNFGGSSAPDLLVGSSDFTHAGNSECGAAWGVFGPINSGRDLTLAVGSASGPAAEWFGAGANDHLGIGVEVADMLGTTAGDVIISANQQRKGGLQVGAVNVWAGSIVNGSTFDLSAANVPSVTILGADQYDGAGSGVSAGDWNNDGIQDLAVASYAADGPLNARDRAGEMVVVLGSRSMSGTIDLSTYTSVFKVIGAAAVDTLGSRMNNLAFADINGDGAADICLGSPKGGTGGALTAPGRIDCFQ